MEEEASGDEENARLLEANENDQAGMCVVKKVHE
jgi:hypothetical protein